MVEKALMYSLTRQVLTGTTLFASLSMIAPSAEAVDTGDAPDSYGLASHEVVLGSPFLGDDEPDNNQVVNDPDALGDDNDGLDDEGGVFAFPILVQNGKSYDTNVFATNPTSVNATLVGWIDFDGNGVFDSDEAAKATVAPGVDNEKFKLQWPDLSGISSNFSGTSFARFRITTDTLGENDATGTATDGEVEDYSLSILLDSDGDERPNITDLDNDNDGIPDSVEGVDVDTDNDGKTNNLDVDSDADSRPDFVEAGPNPLAPVDTDNDGIPDYLDLDSNGDGVPDSQPVSGDADKDTIPDAIEGASDTDQDGVLDRNDVDSDNDTIPDVIEVGNTGLGPVDTDGDGIADYLDNDSDNDGITDIREANTGELDVNRLDTDNDGRVDSQLLTGANGLVDAAETAADSGVPVFAVGDSDGDGNRDFRELDSDADGVFDISEVGGTDVDGNGLVDSSADTNQDGIVDSGNWVQRFGGLIDGDSDGVPDFQDENADGSQFTSDGGSPSPENPDAPPIIETGLSGGAGCSVLGYGNGSSRPDSLLLMLLLTAIAGVFRKNPFMQ